MLNVASFSYLAAFLCAFVLLMLLLTAWRGRLQGLSTIAGIGGVVIWSAINLASALGLLLPAGLLPAGDLLRNMGLFLLLTSILTHLTDRRTQVLWYGVMSVIAVIGVAVVILSLTLVDHQEFLFAAATTRLSAYFWLIQSIIGLLLLEQIFRNYPQTTRWMIKHLCLGIGAVFAYDLFFFSDAILIQRVDLHLWQARGIVNAIAVPLIAVSVARNPSWSMDIHVSRTIVFYSATLLGSGLYLTAMSLAGYYVRAISGAWGATLQIAFFFAAGLFLMVLLFSGHLRARLRVLLNEHFFSFKYDYRSEWTKFTSSLAASEVAIPKTVIQAIAEIVDSTGGVLWAKNERGAYECLDRLSIDLQFPASISVDDQLISFLIATGWVIDLKEMRVQPDHYPGFAPPDWLLHASALWLVIPLFFRDELIGFVLLSQSKTLRKINWEDRSLLKTAGLQAASLLAQYLSDQALMRARQFEAFNQLSAYVAHDLKNLLAQQSLIVDNAEKHKDNPAFIDDVILTIKNSVARMERLMVQLRDGTRDLQSGQCSLNAILAEAITRQGSAPPMPTLSLAEPDMTVIADEERLITALGHLLKNAREATNGSGSVHIGITRDGPFACIGISDDGCGMSDDFINNRLFKPFDSTKGLTGMGIGAFESREFVQALGGRIDVCSKPGKGTDFFIRLPCADDHQPGHFSPDGGLS